MSNRSKWAHWNRAKRGWLLWLLICILSLCSSAHAQEAQKPQLIGERDKGKEEVVAKLFETIRADAQLPALIRITHRDDLEQTVCTVAQVGTLGNPAAAGFYETAQPESISAQLNEVASFKEQRPPKGLYVPEVFRRSLASERFADRRDAILGWSTPLYQFSRGIHG